MWWWSILVIISTVYVLSMMWTIFSAHSNLHGTSLVRVFPCLYNNLSNEDYQPYKDAIALGSQHQHDLRTVVINNISEVAFYTRRRSKTDGEKSNSASLEREEVYEDSFIRQWHSWLNTISQKIFPTWISKLDTNDTWTYPLTPNHQENLWNNQLSYLTSHVNQGVIIDKT